MFYIWETLHLFYFHFHHARTTIGVYNPLEWKTLNTDLEPNCLIKKSILYGKFRVSTAYSNNSTIGKNPYSSNHSYNSANYQIDYANCIDTIRPQNFYSTLKQGETTQPICQNFNNRNDCRPTCQYRHLYGHYAGSYLAKDCPSSATALGSNSILLWHQ